MMFLTIQCEKSIPLYPIDNILALITYNTQHKLNRYIIISFYIKLICLLDTANLKQTHILKKFISFTSFLGSIMVERKCAASTSSSIQFRH